MPQIKLKKEVLAHMELSRLGSVMAKDREPEWRTRNPLLGTVLDIVDSVLAFGPDPLDIGGAGKAEELAGVFRALSLNRQVGLYNAQEYAALLMEHPRYARYKQLVEGLVRKGLGEKFTAYRGIKGSEPFQKTLEKGADLPPSTAVSLREDIAREMSSSGKMLEVVATPESVIGLTARRATSYGHEKELILDPRWTERIEVRAATPYKIYEEELTNTVNQVLWSTLARGRPIPGAGSKAVSGMAPETMEHIIEGQGKLKKQKWVEIPQGQIPYEPTSMPAKKPLGSFVDIVTDPNYGGFPASRHKTSFVARLSNAPKELGMDFPDWLNPIQTRQKSVPAKFSHSAKMHAAAIDVNLILKSLK